MSSLTRASAKALTWGNFVFTSLSKQAWGDVPNSSMEFGVVSLFLGTGLSVLWLQQNALLKQYAMT